MPRVAKSARTGLPTHGERSVSTYASRRVIRVSSYDSNACSLQLSSSLIPHRGAGRIKRNRRRERTDLTRTTCISV